MKKRQAKNPRRPAAMLDLVLEWYGARSAPQLARRLKRDLGIIVTPGACTQIAYEHGIQGATAQGLWSVSGLAHDVSITPSTLYSYCSRMRIPLEGEGKFRFVPEAHEAEIRRYFAEPPEPTMSVAEAAKRLSYSKSTAERLILAGKLLAYPRGGRLRVSIAAVEEMLHARRLLAARRAS